MSAPIISEDAFLAATVRAAELAIALEELIARTDLHFDGPLRSCDWKEYADARDVLARQPAAVLERARARDDAVIELLAIRHLIEGAEFEDISDDDDLVVVTIEAPQARRINTALTNLDALQPVKGGQS